MTAPTTDEQTFDAWWREAHGGDRTTEVCGVTVKVPTDLPFGFAERFAELQESEDSGDAAELVALLFGDDAADAWLTGGGIGVRQLFTILAWGMAQASGEDITFQAAYDAVMAGLAGKAAPATASGPNRAARRSQSASTGGRSKRTSSGSTASTRARSRS